MTTFNDKKSLKFFAEAGFEFWETGGGCTAYARRLEMRGDVEDADGAYVMITVYGDACHPEDDDHHLMVGFYRNSLDDGRGTVAEVHGWEEAIKAANRLIEENLGQGPSDQEKIAALAAALIAALEICGGFEDSHVEDDGEEPIVVPVIEQGNAALRAAGFDR